MDFTAFWKLSYGLYVLTANHNGRKNGCIVNTAFQVTAEPPQFAVSVNKENFTHDLIRDGGFFGISVLSEKVSKELIGIFGFNSGKDMDKFRKVAFTSGAKEIPLVTEGTLAHFICEVKQTFSVGTHTIFVGEVIYARDLKVPENPLTYSYYQSVFKGKAPEKAPTYISEAKKTANINESEKWVCSICGYEYDSEMGDPENGIPPGTRFEDLPDDWVCPVCGAPREDFYQE